MPTDEALLESVTTVISGSICCGCVADNIDNLLTVDLNNKIIFLPQHEIVAVNLPCSKCFLDRWTITWGHNMLIMPLGRRSVNIPTYEVNEWVSPKIHFGYFQKRKDKAN